jgi:multidrug efflux pump subunit AcrA (membrane-fusion protein)
MEPTTYTVPQETAEVAAQEPEVLLQPQRPPMPVKRRRPGRRKRILKRILGVLIGLAITAGMTWLTYIVFFAPEPEFYLTGRIEVWDGTNDKPGEIRNTISGYGFLQPEQSETVTISGDGAILMSNVWYGMPVMEDDVLVILDASAIDKTVEELNKQIAAALAEIESVEKELAKVYENLRVANADQIAMQRAARLTAPFSGRVLLDGFDRLTIGDDIRRNQQLARLVDDSKMKLILYFSYGYENDIFLGQACEVSIPGAMATVNGFVSNIEYIRRVGADGSVSFEVEITMSNPGALVSEMAATASMRTAGGEVILPAEAGRLAAFREVTLTSESQGPLKVNNLRNFHDVREGDLLIELDFVPDTSTEEGYMGHIRTLEDAVTREEDKIQGILEDIDREYLKMDDLTIRSPISGTIMSWVDLWPGMTLSPNNPIQIQIAQMETLTLRGEIYQADIQKVQVGMAVTVDAFVWGEMTTIPGTLTHIDRNATQAGGAAYFPVVISVDNSMGQLMEGTGANFNITLDISVNPIVVPIQAVQRYGRNDFVFIKTPGGDPPDTAVELPDRVVPPGFHAVMIRCGIQSARFIEVTDGLRPEWNGWEVFTQKTTNMPSPAPSFEFDPGTDDPDLLEWFDKGYQQGLEDGANHTTDPQDPWDPWDPGGPLDPGGEWPEVGWPDEEWGWDDGYIWDDDAVWDDDGLTWDDNTVWDEQPVREEEDPDSDDIARPRRGR